MINFQLNKEWIVYPILLKYDLQNIVTLSFPFLKTAKRYITLKIQENRFNQRRITENKTNR
jgi:hypothetical protein